MNKFLKILLFAVFLIVSGVIYQKFYRPQSVGPVQASGRVVEVNVRARKDQWKWDPAEIKVKAGDRVILKIFNEDEYDHGWALEFFGINRRMFPQRETVVDFIASKAGIFQFYCSVPCGEGHYDQLGALIVE